MRRDGVEPPKLESGWVTATWARQCPADTCCSSSTGGSRTHIHGRLKSVALPDWRTVPLFQASPMGFEPTISCVTGRRALRCSTRTYCFRVAQVGVEPTASKVLSRGGLPVAYRAVVVSRQYPEQGSNLQSLGFRPSRSTDGVPGRVVSIKVVPDGIEPSFPGCEPSVVAVGPRDCVAKVDPPGIAPGSPACDTGIFLLDDEPICKSTPPRT